MIVKLKLIATTLAWVCLLASSNVAIAGVSQVDTIDSVAADQAPLIAIGKISAVDLDGLAIEVNGQHYLYDSQTSYIPASVSEPMRLGSSALSESDLGSYVEIYGELIESGQALATFVFEIDEDFVEGASETYLRTILGSVDSTIGSAEAGRETITYSSALHDNLLASLAPGTVAEFLGTTIGSVFVATAASTVSVDSGLPPSSLSNLAGTRGSGLRGTRGSGIRGTRGSGIRGTRGSGIRGTRGSGIRGTRGSGIRGTRGSGIRGTRGSGIRGTRGSGIRGTRGSGIRGTRGSGIRGTRGSGIRGTRGSGIRGTRGSGIRGTRGSGIRGTRGSGIRGTRGSGVR